MLDKIQVTTSKVPRQVKIFVRFRFKGLLIGLTLADTIFFLHLGLIQGRRTYGDLEKWQ